MSRKHYLLSILVLASILSSCSNWAVKSASLSDNKVNFSERIALATLGGKKMESGIPSEDNKPSKPSCVFGDSSSDSMDIKKPLAMFRDILKEGANQSTPLTEEQMEDAFDLLRTGQAKNDIKKTILELLKKIDGFPIHLLTGTPKIFQSPSDFLSPGSSMAGETAKILIRPDKPDKPGNTTFRLAILVYARMNGVNIEEKNLDDLYNYLDTGNEADFDKLAENGLNTIKEQYGLSDMEQAAQKLHLIGRACMIKAKANANP
jgi:hypothetical protein